MGKQFLPALWCHEGGSARWEQQPRGKLLPLTESPAPAGRLGDQKPPGNCVMQPPRLRCWNWSSACSWLHFGVLPPAASQHRGHRHGSLSLLELALEQPPRGWEGGTPVGVGSSGCGCPAASLQCVPLRPWMCSVISKTQRQARIQLGPRPPGRARLSSCGTAGAQERRHSGVGEEGGLDKDNAQLHQAGAPTALAASLCQWRGLGFMPLCMGLLHPSSSLHLNSFNVASMP